MKRHFKDDDLDLIVRKGVYPYEFVDSPGKLEHSCPPPKEAVYSKLRCEGISDAEYKHDKHVYKHVKRKPFLDYHVLNLNTDVCFNTS